MTRNDLKQIIQEVYQEIVNEVRADDPQTQSLINEFGMLTEELNREKQRLKEMEAKHTAMESQIRELLESLESVEDRTLMTERFIAEITRKGYTRDNIKYKDAFALALTKVNEATRRVLEEAVEATKGVTKVASSIGIKGIREDHGVPGEHLAGIEKAKIDIDLANKALSRLAMSPVAEAGGSVPNHPSPFEPTNESAKGKGGWLSGKGKGGKPAVHPSKKGMFDGKSKAEIEKMKAALEKQNDALKKAGKPIPHQNRVKMAQYNFALRAKSKGGITKNENEK